MGGPDGPFRHGRVDTLETRGRHADDGPSRRGDDVGSVNAELLIDAEERPARAGVLVGELREASRQKASTSRGPQ